MPDISDRLYRLDGMAAPPVRWFVASSEVNIEDLLAGTRPGAIITHYKPDDARPITPDIDQSIGCVAGWISEDG